MSNDFSTSALNAINKSAMHHNSARRAATDQFAQVFAQNQADASRRSLQSARQSAPAEPNEPPSSRANSSSDATPAVHKQAPSAKWHPDRPLPPQSAEATDHATSSAAADGSQVRKEGTTPENDNAERAICPREDVSGVAQTAGDTKTSDADSPATNPVDLAINPQIQVVPVGNVVSAPAQQTPDYTDAGEKLGAEIGITGLSTGTVSKANETLVAGQATVNQESKPGKTAVDLPDTDISDVLPDVLSGQKSGKTALLGSTSDKAAPDTGANDKQALTSDDKTLDAFDHALIAKFKADTHAAKADEPASTTLPKSGAQGESVNADKKPALAANAAISKAAVLNPSAAIVLPQPVAQSFQNTLGRIGINAAASVADASATLASLPVSIGSRALKGAREFTIHLDPAELGKVEVKMEINDKGEIKANLTVDRVETLQLLQRDSKTLERALEQAGFKPSDDALQFSLRQDNSQNQHRAGSDWNQGSKSSRVSHSDLTDKTTSTVDVTAAVMSAYARRSNSALDIHV